MNNIETEKNRLEKVYGLGVSEKIIDKKMIGSYLCGDDDSYSLWQETIETNEVEYEKLEPIYAPRSQKGGGCSNSPSHRMVHYQDEKGRMRWNCCIEPRKVKYYKKKHNYYLTYYEASDFKIKTTHLPSDTKGIPYSHFFLVESPSELNNLKKEYKWLAKLLTNGELFFGSKEVENQQIKDDFIKEYNELNKHQKN